jgi:hypothetical protein
MDRPGGEGVGEPFSRKIEMVPFYLSADRNKSKSLMIFGAILRAPKYRDSANYRTRTLGAET